MMEIKEKHCEVCNHALNISKDNVYVAKISSVFTSACDDYDVTDCPYCGCQNILHRRFKKAEK